MHATHLYYVQAGLHVHGSEILCPFPMHSGVHCCIIFVFLCPLILCTEQEMSVTVKCEHQLHHHFSLVGFIVLFDEQRFCMYDTFAICHCTSLH